jgi:hypothetical protein
MVFKIDPFDGCGVYQEPGLKKWKPFYLAVSLRRIKNPFSAFSAAAVKFPFWTRVSQCRPWLYGAGVNGRKTLFEEGGNGGEKQA